MMVQSTTQPEMINIHAGSDPLITITARGHDRVLGEVRHG